MPGSYGELVSIDKNNIGLFPTRLASKCQFIYNEAHYDSNIPLQHHFFIIVMPKPGRLSQNEEAIRESVTEAIRNNRVNLQSSNIIVLETNGASYYNQVKTLMAVLTCTTCALDLRSVYHRISDILRGSCKGHAILGPYYMTQ